jgi:hypothetical protein
MRGPRPALAEARVERARRRDERASRSAPRDQWKLLMRVWKDLWKDVSPPPPSKSFKNAWKAK